MTGRKILIALAHHWGLTIGQIQGPRRSHSLARRRHIAMGLCRRYTDLSFPEIGRLFGGRDHSTVIYGDRVYRRLRRAGDRLTVEAGHVVRGLLRRSSPAPVAGDRFVAELIREGVRRAAG